MSGNPLLVIGLVVLLGVAINFMRLWAFISGIVGNHRAKIARIAETDAHLSFEERIAERMRELEQERSSNAGTAASAPPQGFGRRVV